MYRNFATPPHPQPEPSEVSLDELRSEQQEPVQREDGNTTIEDKLDAMARNNSWNDNNERIVVSIGENAASYKWMHEKCASTYTFYHKTLNLSLTLLNAGLSAQTLITENPEAVQLASRVFIYIVTILSVLLNFLKYQDLAAQHMHAAQAYSEMYHEIQQQMCLYRKDRRNAVEYIQEVLKEYDHLAVSGPQIMQSVLSNFKKTFANADISVPHIADRIQRIEIISEPNFKSQLPAAVPTAEMTQVASLPVNKSNLKEIQHLSCSLQIPDDITDDDLRQRARQNYEMERYRKHVQDENFTAQ
jgi:hypothetical protein